MKISELLIDPWDTLSNTNQYVALQGAYELGQRVCEKLINSGYWDLQQFLGLGDWESNTFSEVMDDFTDVTEGAYWHNDSEQPDPRETVYELGWDHRRDRELTIRMQADCPFPDLFDTTLKYLPDLIIVQVTPDDIEMARTLDCYPYLFPMARLGYKTELLSSPAGAKNIKIKVSKGTETGTYESKPHGRFRDNQSGDGPATIYFVSNNGDIRK